MLNASRKKIQRDKVAWQQVISASLSDVMYQSLFVKKFTAKEAKKNKDKISNTQSINGIQFLGDLLTFSSFTNVTQKQRVKPWQLLN